MSSITPPLVLFSAGSGSILKRELLAGEGVERWELGGGQRAQ